MNGQVDVKPPGPAPAPDATISYRPHLDGMRAFGVMVVIAYHAAWTAGRGVGGMDGFFVVSGFLITTLTLTELDAGSGSVVRFWARRARRLIPALVVVLGFVLVAVRLVESPVLWAARRSDVIATALYYANWHFLASGKTYEEVDHLHDSPLLHAWSLSIEEQFYLLFPVLFFVLLRRGRAGRRVFVAIAAAGLSASVVFGFMSVPSAVHYDSRVRVFAILAGVLTAFAVHYRWLPERPWVDRLARFLAPISPIMVALVSDDMVDRFRWMFFFLVLSSCGLLVAGERGGGIAVRAFSVRPLVWAGKRTYGLYLWHLPLLVLLPRLVGVTGTAGTVLAVVATFLVAEVSYRLVETPVRRARVLAHHPGWTALGSLVVVGSVAAAATLVLPPAPKWDAFEAVCAENPVACTGELTDVGFSDATQTSVASGWMCPGDRVDLDAYQRDSTEVFVGDPLCVLYEPEFPVMVVGLVGDSTTKMLAPGLLVAAAQNNWMLVSAAKDGCPWASPDARIVDPDRKYMWRCQPSTLSAQERLVAEFDPDVIVFNSEFNTSIDPVPATTGQRDAVRRLTAGGAALVAAGPLRWVVPAECRGVVSKACDDLLGNLVRQEDRIANDIAQLEELGREVPLVIGTDRMFEALCPDRVCGLEAGGFPLYVDVRHLTYWASLRLTPVLADLVQEAFRLSR